MHNIFFFPFASESRYQFFFFFFELKPGTKRGDISGQNFERMFPERTVKMGNLTKTRKRPEWGWGDCGEMSVVA